MDVLQEQITLLDKFAGQAMEAIFKTYISDTEFETWPILVSDEGRVVWNQFSNGPQSIAELSYEVALAMLDKRDIAIGKLLHRTK